MTRCVYLVGGPGVGKSALMDSLTLGYDRVPVGQVGEANRRWPRREWLYPVGHLGEAVDQPVAVELGARAAKHPIGFPGTDALPMNAIVSVENWLVSGRAVEEAPLILGEGARLGIRRFVNSVLDSSIEMHLVLVEAENAERRRTHRGSQQKPEWVKGAFTRARRIAEYVQGLGRADAQLHYLHNDGDLQSGAKYLRDLANL